MKNIIQNKLLKPISGLRSTIYAAGFTLIELLVVVAIIGLLSSIVSVAVNTSRVKARDARRVTDIKQVKSGLDIYFATGSGYPDQAPWDAAAGTQLSCSGTPALTVPKDPIDPLYVYTYTPTGNSTTGCGGTVRAGYTIQFYMENKGKYYRMNEDGTLIDVSSGTPVAFDSIL